MNSQLLYKNDLKSELPKENAGDRRFNDKTVQDELFRLWSVSIIYLNDALNVIGKFPEKFQIELLYNISTSALAVSTNISRATNAKTREEFSCYLQRAMDANITTINSFSIFRQPHYVSAEQFRNIFDVGETIKDRILNLTGDSSI